MSGQALLFDLPQQLVVAGQRFIHASTQKDKFNKALGKRMPPTKAGISVEISIGGDPFAERMGDPSAVHPLSELEDFRPKSTFFQPTDFSQ